MLKKIKISILISLIILFLATAFGLACFNDIRNSSTKVDRISTPTPFSNNILKTQNGYIKPDGWEIPLLESMTVVQTYVVKISTREGASITVDGRRYAPKNELVTTDPSITSIISKDKPLRINNVAALSFGGKTFAYSFVTSAVTKDEKSGKYSQDGPGLVYLYVDEDGDGLFERLKADSSEFYVPKWVYER